MFENVQLDFFPQIIPPLGNTSFSVVFLGRGEGEIKDYLYIHTSEGIFKYQVLLLFGFAIIIHKSKSLRLLLLFIYLKVKGASVESPYRVRSLSGVKLPLNATYTPDLYMHNPHPTVLQVICLY